MTRGNLLLAFLATIALFSATVGAFYAILVPHIWPAYKTYFVLVAGVAAATITGGYLSLRATANSPLLTRILLTLGGAVGVGVLVLLVALFIILNTRGA
jgi:hypothetical protein